MCDPTFMQSWKGKVGTISWRGGLIPFPGGTLSRPGGSGIETPVPGRTCLEMCPRVWEVLPQGPKQVNNTQDREVDWTLPGCMLTIINVSWPRPRSKLTGSLGWRTCTRWLSLGAWASQNTACNEMETPPSQCFWRTRATQPTRLWPFHLLIQSLTKGASFYSRCAKWTGLGGTPPASPLKLISCKR